MYVFGSGREVRIGCWLYQSYGEQGECGTCGCVLVAAVSVGSGLGQEGWDGVMSVCVVSLDSLRRWQVHVSVYCTRLIHGHLRCTQYSIMLHLIDICFLPYIFLWQILQIQTCLCVVVGPGLVSTSPAFLMGSASHPAVPHGRLAQKRLIGPPLLDVGGVGIMCTDVFQPTGIAPPRVGCVVWR